jgi:hypothetical protein
MIQDSWWLNDLEDDDEAGSRVRVIARSASDAAAFDATLSGVYFEEIVAGIEITEGMTVDADIANTNSQNTYDLYSMLDVSPLVAGLQSGEYFEAIILLSDQLDTSSSQATLISGVYFTVTYVLPDQSDARSAAASLYSGNYFLIVVSPPDQSDARSAAASLYSGDYFDAVEVTPDQTDGATSAATLTSGNYALA